MRSLPSDEFMKVSNLIAIIDLLAELGRYVLNEKATTSPDKLGRLAGEVEATATPSTEDAV